MTSKFLLTTCALLVSLPAFAQEWTKDEQTAGLKTIEYTRHIPSGKQRALSSFGYLNADCSLIEDTDTVIFPRMVLRISSVTPSKSWT
jgi:hypothetical protein